MSPIEPGNAAGAAPAAPDPPAPARTLDELCRQAKEWGFLEPFRRAALSLRDRFGFWSRLALGQAGLIFLPLAFLAMGTSGVDFRLGPLLMFANFGFVFLFAIPFVAASSIGATLEAEIAPEPSAARALSTSLVRIPGLLWIGFLAYLSGMALLATAQFLPPILIPGVFELREATSPWVGVAVATLGMFVVLVLAYRFVVGVCLAIPEAVLTRHQGVASLSHGFAMASSETTNLFAFQLLVNLVGSILKTQFLWFLGKLVQAGTVGARMGLGFAASPATVAFGLLAGFGAWMLIDWWFAVWTYRYFWERGREAGLAPAAVSASG